MDESCWHWGSVQGLGGSFEDWEMAWTAILSFMMFGVWLVDGRVCGTPYRVF